MVPKYNIEAVAGEAAAGPEVASSQSSAGEADSDEPRDSTPAFRSSIGRSLNRLLSEARGGDAEGELDVALPLGLGGGEVHVCLWMRVLRCLCVAAHINGVSETWRLRD